MRPGGLVDTETKSGGKYKLGPHKGGRVSRVDLAEVIVRLAENDQGLWDAWEGKPMTVAY